MDTENLKDGYPLCHDAFKKYVAKNNLHMQLELSWNFVFTRWIISEGYVNKSILVDTLREHEKKLRAIKDSQLDDLVLPVPESDCLTLLKLNIGQTYKVRMNSQSRKVLKGVYQGKSSGFVHQFKTIEGVKYIISLDIPKRVFILRENKEKL